MDPRPQKRKRKARTRRRLRPWRKATAIHSRPKANRMSTRYLLERRAPTPRQPAWATLVTRVTTCPPMLCNAEAALLQGLQRRSRVEQGTLRQNPHDRINRNNARRAFLPFEPPRRGRHPAGFNSLPVSSLSTHSFCVRPASNSACNRLRPSSMRAVLIEWQTSVRLSPLPISWRFA